MYDIAVHVNVHVHNIIGVFKRLVKTSFNAIKYVHGISIPHYLVLNDKDLYMLVESQWRETIRYSMENNESRHPWPESVVIIYSVWCGLSCVVML